MQDLVVQILLDNAPWPAVGEQQMDHPGMPAWATSAGLFIRHPDGGLIYLPLIDLFEIWQNQEPALAAAQPLGR